MEKLGIACMPSVKNIPNPQNKQWTKTKCTVCGCDCWETDTFKWAKKVGVVRIATCTECALKIENHD